MILTDEDRAILAHRVVDVDAWVTHALATVGEWAVRAKIEKYREPYLTEVRNRGDGYKTRAERQADADAALNAQVVAMREAQERRRKDAALVLDTLPTQEAKDAFSRLMGIEKR